MVVHTQAVKELSAYAGNDVHEPGYGQIAGDVDLTPRVVATAAGSGGCLSSSSCGPAMAQHSDVIQDMTAQAASDKAELHGLIIATDRRSEAASATTAELKGMFQKQQEMITSFLEQQKTMQQFRQQHH